MPKAPQQSDEKVKARCLLPLEGPRRQDPYARTPAEGARIWDYVPSFIYSRDFWVIAGVVTLLHVGILWMFGGLTIYQAIVRAQQTFTVKHYRATLDENGNVIRPGEVHYTVPSQLVDLPLDKSESTEVPAVEAAKVDGGTLVQVGKQ